MSATCSNSEGRKPEVSLTFNGRKRGEVACAPQDVTSGEDGAVGGGEYLRDEQIRFSGQSRFSYWRGAFLGAGLTLEDEAEAGSHARRGMNCLRANPSFSVPSSYP